MRSARSFARAHALAAACSSAAALSAAIFLLVLSSSALASTNATASQAKALTRAVHTTSVAGINRIPTNRYQVSRIKISTVSKSWASASVVPTKRYQATLQGIEILAVKLAGTGTWVVVDAGTAEVGCGIAPESVLADLLGLKSGEQPCPPGEGIASAAAAESTKTASSNSVPVSGAAVTRATASAQISKGRLTVTLVPGKYSFAQTSVAIKGRVSDLATAKLKIALKATGKRNGTGTVTVTGARNSEEPDVSVYKVTWSVASTNSGTIRLTAEPA